jgi:uracil phosphoribosyltransferase
MENLKLLDHPVLKHKLSYLRDKNTLAPEFRNVVGEISRFLGYEATRDLETFSTRIETPLGIADSHRIKEAPVIVSIMRAGNAMLDSLLTALPFARAGHIGIYRDKFIKNTVEYYFKLPEDVKGKKILLVDPLLATGDTIIASVDRLKQYEVGEIRVLSILASRQGLEAFFSCHPEIKVFTLEVEEQVDERGYLIPGLGDAGDRLYNTK